MTISTLNAQSIISIIQSLTPKKKLWVAYSGGLDSHVLLDLIHKNLCPEAYQLGALHIHHGLSPNADAWMAHCEKICSALKIPFSVLYVDATVTDGKSPEEVAREARFQAFENFLKPDECLVFAHHASDQAETILLRLFRGAGPLGLSGMREQGTLGLGEFVRPLLSFTREMLVEYAKAENLVWVEDESNLNTRFDRNFLRLEVLPLLTARWPRVVRSVSRAGALCLETATAVQVLAEADLERVKSEVKGELSVKRLLQLEPTRRKGVLRYWLYHLGFQFPSHAHTERIDKEILQALMKSRPRLKIDNYEIVRIRDQLKVNVYEKALE